MREYDCLNPELLLCIKRDCRIEISDLESCFSLRMKWVMWPDRRADTNQVSLMLHSNDEGWEGGYLSIRSPLSIRMGRPLSRLTWPDIIPRSEREIASNCQQPCPELGAWSSQCRHHRVITRGRGLGQRGRSSSQDMRTSDVGASETINPPVDKLSHVMSRISHSVFLEVLMKHMKDRLPLEAEH